MVSLKKHELDTLVSYVKSHDICSRGIILILLNISVSAPEELRIT